MKSIYMHPTGNEAPKGWEIVSFRRNGVPVGEFLKAIKKRLHEDKVDWETSHEV